jgi:uncharacterized protein
MVTRHETCPRPDASGLEVYEHASMLAGTGDYEGWAHMFADDGYYELPLAPDGLRRRLTGPADIKRYLLPAQQKVRGQYHTAVVERRVHTTHDPQVVVCELTVERTAVDTDDVHRISYAHIVRAANGKIASYRDFTNLDLALKSGADDVLATLRVSQAQ